MGAREAGRIMVRNKTQGNIINISSVRGEKTWPNDIAEAILFLVSEKASYITGTLLTIDGGLTIASMPEHEQKDEPGYHRWGYTPEIH